MQTRQFKKGEVIFLEKTLGNTMYEIQSGQVGIYLGHGTPGEKQLTTLDAGRIFGEMAVIEVYPRSATAVALEDTVALEISAADLQEYFDANPAKLAEIMRAMTRRLRELTVDYNAACDALDEWKTATKTGGKKRSGLMGVLDKFAKAYSEYAQYSALYGHYTTIY